MNISKAAGGYWKAEDDIREYATLYSPLSDYRVWENDSDSSEDDDRDSSEDIDSDSSKDDDSDSSEDR